MDVDELETLIGMLTFHTSAVATLASRLADEGSLEECEMISSIIKNSPTSKSSVTEHALWETLSDFFSPVTNEMVREKELRLEGDNVVDITRKDH